MLIESKHPGGHALPPCAISCAIRWLQRRFATIRSCSKLAPNNSRAAASLGMTEAAWRGRYHTDVNTDVNYDVSSAELTNPQFTACIDRNA